MLTFGAVFTTPAGQADLVAGLGARVVAELVVARPAQVGAAVAVVVLVALDAVAVGQDVLSGVAVRVVLPQRRLAPALRRHLHDQHRSCNGLTCKIIKE